MEMEIPPITVASATTKKKKPGPAKSVSWKDDFRAEFIKRLETCQSLETLEAECEHLALWFAKKKIRPPGEKAPISASRLRELYREFGGDAEKYKKRRQAYIDCYVKAGMAFLAQFPGIHLPDPLDP